jgi:hypothetical protein
MKYLLLAVIMILGGNCFGQIQVYRGVDKLTGDSIITSGTDTLDGERMNKKRYLIECEVKLWYHKGRDKKYYMLDFYFDESHAFSVSSENSAYIKFSDSSIIKLPNLGKYKIYGEKERAIFTIDPEPYLRDFKTKDIIYVRLSTSEGPHDVFVPDEFKSRLRDIFLAVIN